MKRFCSYIAEFKAEENGQYSYRFPALPGCFGGGNDYLSALKDARELLAFWLKTILENSGVLPKNETVCVTELDAAGNLRKRPIGVYLSDVNEKEDAAE